MYRHILVYMPERGQYYNNGVEVYNPRADAESPEVEREEDFHSPYFYLDDGPQLPFSCDCLDTEFGKRLDSTDMDLSSFEKETPLRRACNFGCLKVVKMVIEAGADVNTKDRTNWTPLHETARVGGVAVCKYLLQQGADTDSQKDHIMLPLHIACTEGHLGVICVLGNFMEKKENSVNPFNIISNGHTPLICAVKSKHASLEVVKYLIDKGADVNIPSDTDLLPLHFAVSAGDCDIYDLIKSKTKSDIILKYCTFQETTETNDLDRNWFEESFWSRSIFCRAVKSCKKVLIERVLKLGIPNEILNCPQVFYNTTPAEGGKKYILFSPFFFFFYSFTYYDDTALDVLKIFSDYEIYIIETFNNSDMFCGPIETILFSRGSMGVKFKVINYLLENGADADEGYTDQTNPQIFRSKILDGMHQLEAYPDEGYINPPTELLKICIKILTHKCIIMLLLKRSNVVEPEDLLRWIVMNSGREYIPYVEQDLVYVLLTLSPYFIMTPPVYEFFINLPCRCNCLQEGNVSDKMKQIYVQPIQSLANFCRSVVRRQLHYETRNNYKQFTEKLNSLHTPKVIISYLKFSEIKFTFNECLLPRNS